MKHKGKRLLSFLMALGLLAASALPAGAVTEPEIVAESAVVMDYETGQIIYAKDADSMRVPASMTKVMTAYIIFEELEAGNLTLDTQVPVSAENAARSRNSDYPAMVPLTAGSTLSVDTLIKLILLPSASASCIVAADYISGSEAAFVERMNATAKRLGMTAAYENCHGAFPHYITARSQAMLVRAFIQRFPQILEYTSLPSMEFDGRAYPNTNKLLGDYYYEDCDGFKTGTIPEAGYCLCATAERNGRRIITVIMKSSDDEHRHTDSRALLDYGFDWLAVHSPVFDDIGSHWARADIEALASTGTALHTMGGDYRPDQAITRGELTAMLLTALEPHGWLDGRTPSTPPAFLDLDGAWAEEEILRAASLGLVSGMDGNLFAPDSPITREQTMVILDSALRLPDAAAPTFSDSGQVSAWASQSVSRVTAAGLFQGNGAGTLNPLGTLTRAEAAVVVCNVLDWIHA